MGGPASGLLLCVLGLVLLRRDLRGLWRRLRWAPANATVRYEPQDGHPRWRFEFTLPDGTPVSVTTRDLRLVARRGEDAGPVPILYDPAAPGRCFEVPPRPGLATAVGIGLLGLGLAGLVR